MYPVLERAESRAELPILWQQWTPQQSGNPWGLFKGKQHQVTVVLLH